MSIHRLILGGTVAAAMCLVAAHPSAQETAVTARAFTHFETAAHRYAAFHRKLARTLYPAGISEDMGNIQQLSDSLADAIIRARKEARGGDLFGPAAGRIRRVIAATLSTERCSPLAILAASTEEPHIGMQFRADIHTRMDWDAGAFMPACLIAVLPALPDELEYRFVGTTLVLIDMDADLIIDVLPNVLADRET